MCCCNTGQIRHVLMTFESLDYIGGTYIIIMNNNNKNRKLYEVTHMEGIDVFANISLQMQWFSGVVFLIALCAVE